jgi:chromosome segregation ATPase
MDTLNRTLEGADIEWVSLEAHKLLSEIRETNRHLGQLIGGEETRRVISEAASTLASARRIVENAEKPASEFLTAMAETRSVMSEASSAMASLRRVIENAEMPVNSVLGDLRETAANTNALAEKLSQFPEELNSALAQLQSTLGKFDQLASAEQQDIEITLNNIRLISEHLEALTDDIRQYPSHLLFGDPPEPLNLEKD